MKLVADRCQWGGVLWWWGVAGTEAEYSEEDEKERRQLIEQVFELQNTLDGLLTYSLIIIPCCRIRRVGWVISGRVCNFVCLCVRTLKEKRLELSTPNFVHTYCLAGAWHALTQRWESYWLRSQGCEVLLVWVCVSIWLFKVFSCSWKLFINDELLMAYCGLLLGWTVSSHREWYITAIFVHWLLTSHLALLLSVPLL